MATKTVYDAETGEVLESKEVVVSTKGTSAVMIGGKRYEVAKQVNVPTLKQDSGETVVFRIDQPIRQEINIQKKEVTIDGIKRLIEEEVTINVVRVSEISSGQPFEYVCNAMTADNLRNAYPEHGYVGRVFAVQKLGVVAGKRYKETKVVELIIAE